MCQYDITWIDFKLQAAGSLGLQQASLKKGIWLCCFKLLSRWLIKPYFGDFSDGPMAKTCKLPMRGGSSLILGQGI